MGKNINRAILFIFLFSATALPDIIADSFQKFREKRQSVDEILDPENLQNLLSRTIQEDGVLNPHLLFRDMIAEPILVPDFNITSVNTFTEIDGQFRILKLYGLRQLLISRVHVNVVQMNISVKTLVPSLRLDGLYNLDGTVTFFNVEGNGDFYMNVTDTVATGSATIITLPNGQLEVDHVDFNVDVGDIELHFDNLMGGGSLSSVSNTLLNVLSDLIFEQVRATMLDELKVAVKKEMNVRLQAVPNGFFVSNTTIFDSLLEKAGEQLRLSGMDPMSLPTVGESFFKRAVVVNVHGRLSLFNGTLSGLSTLRRTGDIILTYENNSVTLEASLGFGNLTGSYGWNAHFMGVGPTGRVTLSIGSISSYISIRQDLKTGSRPQILDLEVKRIGHVWLDFDGLGTLDFILEIFINIISNALKHHIANVVVGPVRTAVQRELDSLPVFLF